MWNNLKQKLNLSENYISMLLGFLVVLVLGVFVFNIFKRGALFPEKAGETGSEGLSTQQVVIEPGQTHIVAKGETLWSIAEKYYQSGYNWVSLVEANHLVNPNRLEEGTELIVPQVTPIVLAQEKAPETVSVTAAPAKVTANSYTVKHGDNLWKIAVEVYQDGYRWLDIARANNLVHPNVIHAGNVLTLPAN